MFPATLLTLALASGQATLQAYAQLEAHTLMPGPDSGHLIEAPEGLELPFRGQPAQGFSSILPDGNGGYLALADNGFGTRGNSADFLLRVYSLQPDFRTAEGGSGEIHIFGFVSFSDPQRHLPWPITADRAYYDAQARCWPVDTSLNVSRLLTGADLDPEALQRADDGSFWIADEFGPYVVQMDAEGAVLGPPMRLQGLASEANPEAGCCDEEVLSVPASRGFEGLALAPSGERLYPMLEAPLPGQPGQVNIYELDMQSQRFLNASVAEPSYRYRLDDGATAVGDFVLATEYVGLVLERDSRHGPDAKHKKVYRVDLRVQDTNGYLTKLLVADLLEIADPHDLDQDGHAQFAFSFHTPEALIVLDRNTIGLVNDNNYPFGRGRGGADGPAATEFILIETGALW